MDKPLLFVITLIFLSMSCMAAFGFLLNEWTDRSEDLQAGRQNRTASLHPVLVYSLLIILVFASFGALVPLNPVPVVFLLWLLQVLFLLAYHLPPLRLKNHWFFSVVLDAAYSGTVYAALIWCLIAGSFTPTPVLWLMTGWFFLRGLRNILYHLLQSEEENALIGRETAVTRCGDQRVRWVIVQCILPFEVLLFSSWIFFLPIEPLYCWLVLGSFPMLIVGSLLIRKIWNGELLSDRWNNTQEILFPYISVLALSAATQWYWLLLHAAFFPRPFIFLLRQFRMSIKGFNNPAG